MFKRKHSNDAIIWSSGVGSKVAMNQKDSPALLALKHVKFCFFKASKDQKDETSDILVAYKSKKGNSLERLSRIRKQHPRLMHAKRCVSEF